MSWCDTYKPSRSLEIVGRTQEVRDLDRWLAFWNSSQSVKAVLLSGPPGSGKSLVAEVVAKEAGFSVFHVDPTATKGNKVIRKQVEEFTRSRSIGLFQAGKQQQQTKQCLFIEIDKLRERAELIQIIKETRVPIVCFCNDRDDKNLRTLISKCHEIRFSRLPANAIVAHASKVLSREGKQIPDWLPEFAACGDMRFVLNTLQFGGGNDKDDSTLHYRNAVFKLLDPALSLDQKEGMFFVDSFLVPLSVQDAYLSACSPYNLDVMSKAADSISCADLVESFVFDPDNHETPQIYENLMPYASLASSVAPLSTVSGRATVPFFPSWPGKQSTRTKNRSMLTFLSRKLHMKPSELILDTLPTAMVERATLPLIQLGSKGAESVKDFLRAYHMDREDWQVLIDLSLTKVAVPAASKSALTRAMNSKRRATKGKASKAPPKKVQRR